MKGEHLTVLDDCDIPSGEIAIAGQFRSVIAHREIWYDNWCSLVKSSRVSGKLSCNQSVNQSISQAVTLSVKQSIDRPIKQSFNQSINQ